MSNSGKCDKCGEELTSAHTCLGNAAQREVAMAYGRPPVMTTTHKDGDAIQYIDCGPTPIERLLIEALMGMVKQHCETNSMFGKKMMYDSGALGYHAEAIRLLGKLGYMKITKDFNNRNIRGYFTGKEKEWK